jgi:uncharacterized protein
VRDEAAVLRRFAHDRQVGPAPDTSYHPVAQAPPNLHERPLVVGFGPCGLFAALLLAQMGFRPIVLERGRDVRRRTKDTWALWRRNTLTPESNVQFGEGGAGLFSDGKLYSQIKDPKFYGRKVMHEFVRAGAPEEILYVSKPHIGTFRLTGVVAAMRAEIIALGGEVRFESRVTDLLLDDGQVEGVVLESGETLRSRHVVLALGHSSRDTFRMLERRGVFMEPKPFAIGFRIEHPQSLIDRARLGRYAGHPALGAADYKLVHHASNGRAVYSFCMCPGGTVVAATSEAGARRHQRHEPVFAQRAQRQRRHRGRDQPRGRLPGGPARGRRAAGALESVAYELGGSDYCAPGQLVGDFLQGVPSRALGEVEPSYKPGVRSATSRRCAARLCHRGDPRGAAGLRPQIRGFDRPDAVFTGVETRTSSPVRITRDDERCRACNVRGLYPCGEGAGYAGGILSAGVDGIRVAEAVARSLCGAEAEVLQAVAR